jgi:hypothetical protein
MYYDLSDLDHDPKLATALGNMVVVWAFAEATLVGALSRITGLHINQAMKGYYRIPTFEARVKFLQAILVDWKDSGFDKAAIEHEITAINRLAAVRNEWVHGVWCCNIDKSEVVIFNFRKEPDKENAPQPKTGRRKIVKSNEVKIHVAAVKARAKQLEKLIRLEAVYDRLQ